MIKIKRFPIKKKIENDMLRRKEERLTSYLNTFDTAISAVTKTIDQLESANNEISTEIEEIESYQSGLEATKGNLENTKTRNEKVIQNFRTLIGE